MNNYIYIGFCCITLLCSCTNENKESTLHIYDKFPQTKELYATPVAIDSTLFRYPFRIRVTGDRAIVFDLHNADYFFHLFTYPDFHYLSSFGKLGDSPQEMISADNIRFKNDKECWALDGNKEKWFVYRLSEKRDSMLLNGVVPIDRRIQRALDFVFINDSVLLVPDYTGKHRFCLLNTKGCLLYSQGRIPTTKGQALSESTQAFAQAWRSFVD
jgi:hypothetical protein